MDVSKIINQLIENDIISSKLEYKPLTGGTVSELYLLKNVDNSHYVIKINEPNIVKSEAEYLNYYKNIDLIPNLIFVEPSYKYIVYSFIPGTTDYTPMSKKDLLIVLVLELINNYKTVTSKENWGWADDPSKSWRSFLRNEITRANTHIAAYLGRVEYDFVLKLIPELSTTTQPYLLHGDCGMHNFIFDLTELKGVIDPAPVLGRSYYDLIYAFCSSPTELTTETIDSAMLHLTTDDRDCFSYKDVLIVLYLRIAACIKHHPNDFEEYKKAWYYWKEIITKS
ncbi:phosphotransferase [Cytobacillus sp. IB215665]|uniref:phosphotransferase n=1 Tax=Cytobacillus sp. IB215665 TaxID=3097357 RepID=UPI002A1689FD|nr:phosphotransferase [Cytobacillus sp. IB215665]MDX8365293.1 aminoglycoside phosphotransferase family protein [Cytobacillus sp. IB215665]